MKQRNTVTKLQSPPDPESSPGRRRNQPCSPPTAASPASELSRLANKLANLESANSANRPRFAFIMTEFESGTPKPNFKPGAFEFSLPQQARIGKYGAQIQHQRRTGEPIQLRPYAEKTKNAGTLMTQSMMQPQLPPPA